MIIISRLSKKFKQQELFRDLSLNIEQGTIVGLTGPSGGGKSTLLRCIQGLEKIDSGIITISGEVGFIFQDFQLFPHFNVLKNVMYAPLKLGIKNKQEILESSLELLANLGLSEHVDKYPAALSGGQKQRVAVARALIMHPELLLCDEPTSGLDIGSIENLMQLFKKLKEIGVTMLVSSHDIRFLTEIASRILVLKNGKIVNDLVHDEFNSAITTLEKALLKSEN